MIILMLMPFLILKPVRHAVLPADILSQRLKLPARIVVWVSGRSYRSYERKPGSNYWSWTGRSCCWL